MSYTREYLLDSVNDWAKFATIIPAQALQTIRGKTSTTKKENNIWGDDLTGGKETGTLQIYFININGACKQENWEEYKRTIAMKITEQVHKKNYRIETSSSNEITVNQYQPGGTMIGIIEEQQGRILEGN
eukprot:14102459-Ditylum_brightwellii.AAC.2